MSEGNATQRRRAEASNPATGAQRLETLSTDAILRCIVGGNPAAPASLLETLAQDQDRQVRALVASNEQVPVVGILQTLSQDQNARVRRTVAGHMQTPGEIRQPWLGIPMQMDGVP